MVGTKGGLGVATGQPDTARKRHYIVLEYENCQNILCSCGERHIVVGQLVGIEY